MSIISLPPFLPDKKGAASTRTPRKGLPLLPIPLELSDTSTSESSTDEQPFYVSLVPSSSKARRMNGLAHRKPVQLSYNNDAIVIPLKPSSSSRATVVNRVQGLSRVSSPPIQRPSSPPAKLIPSLRSEIDDIDSQMASLMSRRARLGSRLEQAARLQSPISRLPSEIMSSIFIVSICEDDGEPVLVSTLMLVCRFWADVAVSTPLLWSSISVTNLDSLPRAKRRFARSKSVPLALSVDFTAPNQPAGLNMKDVVHGMDLVRVAIARTQSFRLNVTNRAQAQAVFRLCQVPAPALEVLSIRVETSLERDSGLPSMALLQLFNGHTPRLSSCSLMSFDLRWAMRTLVHLRVLKLGGYWNAQSPSHYATLELFKQCPMLQELHLRGLSDIDSCVSLPSRSSASTPQKRPPFCLPHLRKVSLSNAGICRVRSFFACIATPAMENVTLGYLGNITQILPALANLHLRRLRVEACIVEQAKFLATLHRIPSLHVLELVDLDDVAGGLVKVDHVSASFAVL